MNRLSSVALAGALALGLASAAQAQSYYAPPQVPNPANPFPDNPIATNGTPLPREVSNGTLYSGRSAFVGPVGGLVDAGTGLAGGALDAGLGTAGSVVNGTVGTVAR